jgi:hypothetical protein
MTTTRTHTSGPWRVENWKYPNSKEVARRDGIVTIVTESDAIAQLCNLWRPNDDPAETISKNEVMANARLIAAAPELLEALRNLAHPMANDEDLQHALAVIAMAEGRGEA